MSALATPAAVMDRLEAIEADLANRQNDLERAAQAWYRCKRDREKAYAEAFMSAEGTVEQRKATATIATADLGAELEAEWEAVRAVVRVLEARASIGQTILRVQARAA